MFRLGCRDRSNVCVRARGAGSLEESAKCVFYALALKRPFAALPLLRSRYDVCVPPKVALALRGWREPKHKHGSACCRRIPHLSERNVARLRRWALPFNPVREARRSFARPSIHCAGSGRAQASRAAALPTIAGARFGKRIARCCCARLNSPVRFPHTKNTK